MNSGKSILPILFSISLLLLAGCPQQPPAEANKTLAFGDRALVDYILEVEMPNPATNLSREAVYDTSIESVAKAAGIYNSNRTYEPLAVTLDAGNGLLPAFTRALVGMREGGNKTFSLKPGDAYGQYDPSKVFSLDRAYNVSRYDNVSLYYFQTNNLSYEPGTHLHSKYFNAEVVNYTNASVTIKYSPEENQTFLFNGVPQMVVSFDDDNMTIEVQANVGTTYRMQSPKGDAVTAKATAANETHVTFDSNHPLAGKNLKFTVFVRTVEKA